MPSEHATLSASASQRWLTCTPSAQLERRFPSTTSTYAEEGTLAHAVGEAKLRAHFFNENTNISGFRGDPLWCPEIDDCSDAYLDYVRQVYDGYAEPPYIAFEERLDMSDVVPNGFGTGDCVIIGGDHLDIIDYKHGKGVKVDVRNNSQLRLYAYGAWRKYGFLYDVKTVTMHIVQPRLDNLVSETISLVELLGWIEWVRGRAELAAKGEGDFVPGEHCRFCRAKTTCRARAEAYSALADFGYAQPPTLTNDEVGDILQKGKDLSKWIDDLSEYALSECLAGRPIKGWKVVAGKSARKINDMDAAMKRLIAAGFDEHALYVTKPISLTAIEKMAGKRQFADLLGDMVVKPLGAPTLVDENDKREPYSTTKSDFTDS